MSPELYESAERVRSLPDARPEPHEVYAAVKDIKALWESKPIQDAYSRRNQFQVKPFSTVCITDLDTLNLVMMVLGLRQFPVKALPPRKLLFTINVVKMS